GFLFLGSSESIGGFGEMFGPVDAKHRIFVKKPVTIPMKLDFCNYGLGEKGTPSLLRNEREPVWSALDAQKKADRIVMARYAPVGVVVDESGNVIQFRGRTAGYLEPAPGMASLDLMRMLREGLLAEVRLALNQAKIDGAPVVKEGLQVVEGERIRL